MAHPERANLPPRMPFKPGQGRAPKLTPEIHELFVNTVKQTGRWTAAAGRCALGMTTVYAWFAKGRTQRPGQPYRDFWDAATRARADFVTMAAARHHQLAVGGVIKLPAMDKQGNPVRMHFSLQAVPRLLGPNPALIKISVQKCQTQRAPRCVMINSTQKTYGEAVAV
jgi:hypothetical protein